jgi:AraC family transcriptional regulator
MLFAGGPLLFDRDRMNGPGAAQVVRDGDFVLRPGVEPYEVGWKSLSPAPTRALVLHLDRSLFLHTAKELDGCDTARTSLPSRVGFQDPMLKEICLASWRELEQPDHVEKLYVQTAAQMLAVHLLRHYSAGPIRTDGFPRLLTQRQLRSVTDPVLGNLDKTLSLRALAAQAGPGPYHFARLFRKTTGTSPHQFVLAQRLEKARRLLRETNAAMSSVAFDAGFANQSHLTRTFKRRFGITPRACRGKP